MDKGIPIIPLNIKPLVEKAKGLDAERLSAANTMVDYLCKTTQLPGRVVLDFGLPSVFEVVDPTPVVPKRSLPKEPVPRGQFGESVYLDGVKIVGLDYLKCPKTVTVRCPHCNSELTITG